jgi:hypothetical protein
MWKSKSIESANAVKFSLRRFGGASESHQKALPGCTHHCITSKSRSLPNLTLRRKA